MAAYLPVQGRDRGRDHARATLAAAPGILKINRAELAELAGRPLPAAADRVAACRRLRDRHGVRWVLVTAGAEGLEAYDGARLVTAAAPAVPVINSIGSGDAASAGVLAGILATAGGAKPAPLRLEDADLATAARWAAACGSANCRSAVPGAVTRGIVRQLAGRLPSLKVGNRPAGSFL